jgi:hypothetical protein
VLEQSAVRGGLRVVELVHDHHVERARIHCPQVDPGEGLDGGKDMAPLFGAVPVDVELAELPVSQHRPEDVAALLQDLPAVRDEEETRTRPLAREAAVVEGRDQRLAGPRRRDHKVSMTAMALPLRSELLQDLHLEGIRTQLEGRHGRGRGESPGLRQRLVESLRVPIRVVVLELAVLPVAVERRSELLQKSRCLRLAQADVPFQAVEERRVGEVRRAHVGRRKAAASLEEPRLRVKARGADLVGHLHLGTRLLEHVEDAPLSGSDVRRREDTEATPPFQVPPDRRLQHAEAVPLDEGTQQVDPVRRRDLTQERGPKAWLATGVHEQVPAPQGDCGAVQPGKGEGLDLRYGSQQLGRLAECVVLEDPGLALRQVLQDPLADRELLCLRVLSSLSLEGQEEEVMDVAGQEAGKLGGVRSLDRRREPARIQLVELATQPQADQLLVEAGGKPLRHPAQCTAPLEGCRSVGRCRFAYRRGHSPRPEGQRGPRSVVQRRT